MAVSLIPFLFYFFAAFSLIIGVAMCWIFKGRLDTSVRYWIGGTLLSGFAAGVTVLRAELVPLVSFVFANAINFVAYFLFAHSLRSLPNGAERLCSRTNGPRYLLKTCKAALTALGQALADRFTILYL